MRALAVLAVIAYHMQFSWAPGGLLGVTVFFVLSGYLITGLLLRERSKTGTISLTGFWIRRVRRIIPAVVFAVVGTAALCTIFNHVLLTKMRPDVLPTLFFFNNWWQIIHNVSYFEALGQPSPLTHFWSLSIEEQFYLIWPVLLLVTMKLGVRKTTMRRATLVLAIISAVEMALLFDPHGDPSRVYYGTDTRAFSLLIGSYLAFVWPFHKLTPRATATMAPAALLMINIIGIAAIVGIIMMIGLTNGFDAFTYRGGLALCSVLTALAIASLVHPASLAGKFFQLPPFVWVGKCSYSMYLWHYPLILLMTPSGMAANAPWWLRLIQLVVIFAVSAFSYYVVENPIRHGAIGSLLADLSQRAYTLGDWLRRHLIQIGASIALVGVAVGGLIFVPDTMAATNLDALQTEQTPHLTTTNADIDPYDILIIGDSVTAQLNYFEVFPELFPYGHNDSETSRDLTAARDLYRSYYKEGAVGDVVVIGLGTNGNVSDELLDELMAEIGSEKHVWFINARNNFDTLNQINATIKACTERYDNAELIDWYSVSSKLPAEDFQEDGTHPLDHGVEVYGDMIYDAVKSYLPTHQQGEKTRDEQIKEEQKQLREESKDLVDYIDANVRKFFA